MRFLVRRWFILLAIFYTVNLSATESALNFTATQKRWLENYANQKINYCFNANWAPYEHLKDGEHQGIFHDYLVIFTKRLGLEFVAHITPNWTEALAAVQRGDCAFLVGAVKTTEREAFLHFTSPYFNMYNVLVAKPDKPFIGSLDSLNGQRVAGPKNGAVMQWLAREYPNIEQLNVVTGDETLASVLEDKAYAAISPLESLVADYKWQIHNLKIIGKLDYPYPISVAVRKDQSELGALMELAVASLSQTDHAEIARRHQSFTVVEQVNYQKLAAIVAIALLFIAYLYFSNRRLLQEIACRQRAEAELMHLAHHDALTGLPSLRMGLAQLEAAILDSHRTKKLIGLLFIDLDGFKAVNDNFGHQAGDALLVKAASTIQSRLCGSDIAARIGGDEFIVMLECHDNVEAMVLFGQEILRALEGAFSGSEVSARVTASMGLAVCPLHARDADSLIKAADQAMYEAKRVGKNRVVMANAPPDSE